MLCIRMNKKNLRGPQKNKSFSEYTQRHQSRIKTPLKDKCYSTLCFMGEYIHNKMWGGSEEKIMCYTSARFPVIILFTWILTDTRRFNLQRKRKFGWKIRTQHRSDKQDS